MREPQEIEDEEHEQVVERVAAVDVAKASGMVCTRVPHRAGHRRRRYQAGEYRLRPATHQSGQLRAKLSEIGYPAAL